MKLFILPIVKQITSKKTYLPETDNELLQVPGYIDNCVIIMKCHFDDVLFSYQNAI